MSGAVLRFLGGLLLLFAGFTAQAAVLQSIESASNAGGGTELILQFDGQAPEASSYTIADPARIAIDLAATTSGLSSRYQQLGDTNVQSVAVIEAEGRTRLVVNLNQLVGYNIVQDGSQLKVQLGGGMSGGNVAEAAPQSAAPVASAAPASPAPAQTASYGATYQQNWVTGVDFRRGQNGEGLVVIDLSNPRVVVDVVKRSGKIRVEVSDAALKDELIRRIDVMDFGTPVQFIDAMNLATGALIRIDPTDAPHDYLVYQTDNTMTIEVKPVLSAAEEKARANRFPYTGEKLSLNFQDIEVRSVLQLIADFTDLNLVASDTVGGRITLRLQNVPWDQALELILRTKGLDKRQVGNVLMVAPADEIAAREKLELESQKQVAELAPIQLEIIQVNYAKAADIIGMIAQDKELISERGFLSSDPRTNTITIRETAEKIEQVLEMVKTWDVPVEQVLIESRIVIASTSFSKDLGVRWGANYFHTRGDDFHFAGGSLETFSEGVNGEDITLEDQLAVDLGIADPAGSFALGFLNENFLLNLELQAAQSDGKTETVSQPKVVTANRHKAVIKSGTEIPYQEATSSGATNVEFKEAVLSLEVTPQITPDGNIIMDVKVTKDTPIFALVPPGSEPPIDTKSVETQVLVPNGVTVVLGGVFESDESAGEEKIPFLGDIPYLGHFFKSKSKSEGKSELLIFITPKLVKESLNI